VAALIFSTLAEPFSVVVYDPTRHFGRDGSHFPGYYLLRDVQSSGTILVHLAFQIGPEKKITRAQTWRTRRLSAVDISEPPSIANSSTTDARCSRDRVPINTNNGIDNAFYIYIYIYMWIPLFYLHPNPNYILISTKESFLPHLVLVIFWFENFDFNLY